MTHETQLVFGILGVATILFASGRVRLDVTALLVVLALMLTGVLTPAEALKGFGEPVVLMVAGLLVVGEMLTRTGIAYAIGDRLANLGGASEARLLILLMLAAALLGSVMSSTAVVAVFIPVVLTLSARTGSNPSRLLMPLSFAALVSGMLTLIASPSNLVVTAELRDQGLESFSFFSFTPIGLAVLAIAVLYMWGAGRHLLAPRATAAPRTGARTLVDLWNGFGLEGLDRRVRVPPGSALVGRSLADAALGSRFGMRVIAIERRDRRGRVELLAAPAPSTEIHPGDVLAMVAGDEALAALEGGETVEVLPSDDNFETVRRELGLAVVMVTPESRMRGSSLREKGFRSSHRLHALGLRRRNAIVPDFVDESLEAGDSLLVVGSWDAIAHLQGDPRDYLVLNLPLELDEVAPARRRAPVAIAILVAMVALSAFEVVPLVAAVLMAALAAVFCRCLSMDDGYRAIHWSSLVLIAGMLPVADALRKTGGIDVIVSALFAGFGDAGPYAAMTLIFFLTAALGLVMSNTATAVLLAPIAVRVAEVLAISPLPLAVAVVIAASAAFVTPVSTPVVTLVVEPGSYRFVDFVKVGAPLLVLTWLTTLAVTPLVFPF